MRPTLDSADNAWATRPYGEVLAVGDQPGSVLVVPVGSVEQHGYHLPVATDTLLADAVSHLGVERVADDLPVLVSPSVWTGNSPHHASIGGTITTGVEGLIDTLADVAASGVENGFDAVAFVNGHGGNAAVVDSAVSTIGASHPDLEVVGLTYFELATPFADDIRDSETGGMAHGGEFETSLMLHLHPDLVRMDDAEGTYFDTSYERGPKDLLEGGPVAAYRPFEEYSESGAIGDPSLASAEKGEKLARRLADELADVLRNVYEQARGK
jgi:creatinine amidohydrolase